MYKKLIFLVIAVCTVTALSAESASSPSAEDNECYYGLLKIVGDINLEQAEKSIKKILEFAENQDIKGVLLVINSSGGDSGTSEFILREIQMLASQKPVVALAVNNCCSGGYKIAVGAHWIISTGAATIGSIGTVHVVEKYKNIRVTRNSYSADVDYDVIVAGKFKAVTFPEAAPLTQEQRDYIQADVDDTYKIFYTLIARQRNLSLEKTSEWADGKKFTGEKALELGLIDQVGGYSDAVKKLAELIQNNGTSLVGKKLVFVE